MNISYAERARRDIERIASYLRARNPRSAERVGASILRSIERLKAHPYSGRRQDDPSGVRKLIVPGFSYIVYYRIEAVEIRVLAIRHFAQERLYDDC